MISVSRTHFIFQMEIPELAPMCAPEEIYSGFMNLLHSHGKVIGASFPVYPNYFRQDSVQPSNACTPSQPPRSDLHVEVNFGSFCCGHGVESSSRTSDLLLDFKNGGCKINLHMNWDISFFLDISPQWHQHKSHFPTIRYKKREWGSGASVIGEVTMDSDFTYARMFYARLAKDIAVYFWSLAEQTEELPTMGTMIWDDDAPYGSTTFID